MKQVTIGIRCSSLKDAIKSCEKLLRKSFQIRNSEYMGGDYGLMRIESIEAKVFGNFDYLDNELLYQMFDGSFILQISAPISVLDEVIVDISECMTLICGAQ